MFAALVAFKEKHGHCNVPQGWTENPALGTWVNVQRHNYAIGRRLSQDRIARLETLGFAWNATDAKRDNMFAALAAYKERHGDCNVPRNWSENPALGRWVHAQRHKHSIGRLAEDRIARLEALGFRWSRRK